MCLRWMPSNVAPIASIAPRERSLSASVFNSTRRQPQASNACRSISSLASTFTPPPRADGSSRVQPISTDRCSDRSARKRVEPTAVATQCHERNRRPGCGCTSRAASSRAELGARRRPGHRRPLPRARVAGRRPEPVGVKALHRLEPRKVALERRCRPRRQASTLGTCRSTSTPAWSGRSSKLVHVGRAAGVTCPDCGAAKVSSQLSAFVAHGARLEAGAARRPRGGCCGGGCGCGH